MKFILNHSDPEPFQLNGQIQLPTGERLNWELSGKYVFPKETPSSGTYFLYEELEKKPRRLYHLSLIATLNGHPVQLWYYDYEEGRIQEKIWYEGQTDKIKPYEIIIYADLMYHYKRKELHIDLRFVQSILIK